MSVSDTVTTLKLNFSFSFRFVDDNYRIFVIIVVFVTKINLLSSTKIFIFVVVDEKNTGLYLSSRLATTDMGQKLGGGGCALFSAVSWVRIKHKVAWAEA